MDSAEQTDEALLTKIKNLDHISKYNGIDMYFLCTEELSLLPGLYHGMGTTDEFTPKLLACTDTSLHERFLTSSFQLIEGRHITETDTAKAIISKDVAERSGLTVGGTFNACTKDDLRSWNPEAGSFDVTFEVVGIYQTTRSEAVAPGYTGICTSGEYRFHRHQYRKTDVSGKIPGSICRGVQVQLWLHVFCR